MNVGGGGTLLREFLFADDFAENCLFAMLNYEKSEDESYDSVYKLKLLPDTLEEFNEWFIQNNNVINMNLLKRRILGLTSYFKSAQEKL